MAASSAEASLHKRALKRPRSELREPKLLVLKLNDGSRPQGVSVLPEEGSLTVGKWLRQNLEPKDKASWGELLVSYDVDYEAGVGLEDTLDSLGLFQKANRTVVLVVVHTDREKVNIPLVRRRPGDELRKRIAQTDWGARIRGVRPEEELDRAIEAVMSEDVGEIADIEEQLRKIRGRLRGGPSEWTVELRRQTGTPGSDQLPMFRIGDEMTLKLRCVDRIGLSAEVKEPITYLIVRVRSPSPCTACIAPTS